MIFFLFKDIHKEDYIARKNHTVRRTIKQDIIPNPESVHHTQINITDNPTNVMTNISLGHSSYQERL